MSNRPLGILCVLTLCCILIAGLWPFGRPRNDASWAGNQNGIRFGGKGVILSSGPHEAPGSAGTASCTLEIWLQAARSRQIGTIIAFYDPAAPTEFSLFQEPSGLGFRLHNQRNLKGPHSYDSLPGVFRSGKSEFVTITSDSKMTDVYVNGARAKTMTNFPLFLWNLQGQLVAGTSPTFNPGTGWAGLLQGIAIYGEALAPAEVVRHYETWTRDQRPESLSGTRALALYLFDERRGRLVHNVLGGGADLHIPERYSIIHQPFLSLSSSRISNWRDTLLNIAGFVPLGFFFCAYFSSQRRSGHAACITILLGFAVSFGIELVQAYLPNRSSDLLDLATNTLGTAIGVLLHRAQYLRTLLAKARLHRV